MSEQIGTKAVKRDGKGKFLPGGAPVSPGRPRKPVELKSAADEAFKELVALANTTDNERLKSEICRWLYEMQYGKAKQSTELEGSIDTTPTVIKFEGEVAKWSE